ncbi:MAG: radical SAM protein [Spirochaetaceae bacterium]|jgi:MoaA/NifB/PqqE/SkfB family radical SAM enzyme|nr:radical SAM protein [Spirochaetaceae bacterium]
MGVKRSKKGVFRLFVDTASRVRIFLSKVRRNLSLYRVKTDTFDEVFVEITSHCNFHCAFCPSDSLQRKKGDLKDEYMMKILSELRDKGKVIAFHVLGEPLLNRNFFKYLSVCDEYHIEAHPTTNMSLITDAVLENILDHPSVTLIQLSFQTSSRESFALRGSAMAFEEYLALLERIVFNRKRIASNCKININVMNDYHCHHDTLWGIFDPERFRQFMGTVEAWKERLVAEGAPAQSPHQSHAGPFYYRTLDEIPEDFYNRADEIHYEITPNLAVFVKHVGKFGMSDAFVDYLNNRKGHPYKLRNIPRRFPFPIPCWAVKAPCVLSNGEITCCCVDIEGTLSLGNIARTTLEEAAKSKKRARVMKSPLLFETCRKCRGRLLFHPQPP